MEHSGASSSIKSSSASERAKVAVAGGLWTTVASITQLAFQLVALIAFARLLGPEDFGIVSASLVVVALGQTMLIAGIGTAVVQRPNVNSEYLKSAVTLAWLTGLLFAAAIVLVSKPLSSFLGIPQMVDVLWVIAGGIVIQALSLVPENLLVRELELKKLAAVEFSSYLLGYLCVGLTLALLGYGYWALVIAHLCQSILKALGVLACNRKGVIPGWSKSKARDLGALGAGFSLSRLLNFTANNIDNLIVARMLGVEALGFYSRAYQLMMVPARIYGQIADRVMFPVMARANEEPGQLGRTHFSAISASAALGLPASVLLAICAHDVVMCIFGAAWLSIVPPFQLLALAVYFRVGQKAAGTVLRAAGAVGASFWVQASYALCVFAGSILGALHGTSGVAAGVALAVLLHYTFSNVVAVRYSTLSVGELIAAHRSGCAHAAVVACCCVLVHVLMPAGSSSVLRLFLAIGLSVAATVTAALTFPRIFLDEWLDCALRSVFRRRTAEV